MALRKLPFIGILGLNLFAFPLFAATPRSFNLGISATSYQLGKLSQQASGKPSFLGTLFYDLQMEYHIPLGTTWLFSPRLNYMNDTLLAVDSPEKGSKSTLSYLTLPTVYNFGPTWDMSGGLALIYYTVKGKGGTVELENGTGTATFAKPGRTVSSTTMGLILGGAYNYTSLRTGLDLLIQAPFSSDRRSLSLVLSVAWSIYKS